MEIYAGYGTSEIIGRVLIALVFVWVGVLNLRSWSMWASRMATQKVPLPRLALAIGFVVQFVGAMMILVDYRADVGAMLLIGFVTAATALFQRYWEAPELAQQRTMRVAFFNNLAIIGGLFLMV